MSELKEYSTRDLELELKRRGFTEKVRALEKYLQGRIVKSENFVIHDMDELTHNVTVFDTFVSMRPVPMPRHMLIIGSPDYSAGVPEKYETSIYVADHASIYIGGTKKEKVEILIEGDEFPTVVYYDDSSGTIEFRPLESTAKLHTDPDCVDYVELPEEVQRLLGYPECCIRASTAKGEVEE